MATSVGNLWVDVRFNTAAGVNDLRNSLSGVGAAAGDNISSSLSQRMTALGTSMGNVGRQVSLGLSLPLIAFGKAATNVFTEFDTAMTQVVSLSGMNRDVVRGWREDVVDLGAAYGVSAAEAAKGLYFITSSGVAAGDAMEVLEVAVKGSAIGLGSVKTVADVATSAMNQYGKENIDAAEATDILTVAVREGKGEADEMSGALAKVIPLAGSMGVKFGEVAGVMSAMTLSGTSADEAATQINALLTSLQKMPANAQRNMKALTGLDYATVQMDLKTKGLTETLRTVYNAFGENEDAIGKVFGNVRALRGITNLFGEKEAQTLAIINQTTNAYGAQATALAELEQSETYNLEQSKARLSGSMTEIGAKVTPIMAGVTGAIATTIDSLKYLPGPAQTAAVSLATLAAASGPMIYMGGSVMRLAGNIGTLIGKSNTFREAMFSMALNASVLGQRLAMAAEGGSKFAKVGMFLKSMLGPIAVGAAAAAVSWSVLHSVIEANVEAFNKMGEQGKLKVGGIETVGELDAKVRQANEGIANMGKEYDALNEQADSMGGMGIFHLGIAKDREDAKAAADAFRATGEAAAKARGQANALSSRFGITQDAAAKWIAGQVASGKTFNNSQEALDAYTKAIDRHDASVVQATTDTQIQKNTLGGLIAATKETSDAFFGVINAQKAYDAALQAIEDAKTKVTDAEKAHTDALKAVADASRKVTDADRKVVESTQKVTEARQAAADAQKALNDALAGPSEDEQLNLRSAELGVKEAEKALKELGKGGGKKDPLDRERAEIALARARLDLVRTQGEHDERVKDARKDLSSATDAVADAERSREDAVRAAQESRDALQIANDKERETLGLIKVAQDNVAQAQRDAVGPAMDLTAKQSELNTMHSTGTAEGKKYEEYLKRLQILYPNLRDELQKYIDKFKELQDQPDAQIPWERKAAEYIEAHKYVLKKGTTAAMLDRPSVEEWWKSHRRATGGQVTAGQMYSVNERGMPEMFDVGGKQWILPSVSGTVRPVAPTAVGGTQSGVSVGEINIVEARDGRQSAADARRELRKHAFLAGGR